MNCFIPEKQSSEDKVGNVWHSCDWTWRTTRPADVKQKDGVGDIGATRGVRVMNISGDGVRHELITTSPSNHHTDYHPPTSHHQNHDQLYHIMLQRANFDKCN